MEPIQFLDAVSGYVRNGPEASSDRPIKLARIDPAYDPFSGSYPANVPPAKVTFEGESTLSGKTYPVASGYLPQPNARVWMVPIGTTYMIAGGAASYTSQGFYSDPDGIEHGIEFGGGSGWDSDLGLYIENDAEILGDLTVGGIGAKRYVRKTSDTSRTNATRSDDPQLQGLFLDVGLWEIECTLLMTGTTGDIATNWVFSGTYTGVKEISSATFANETFDMTNTAGRYLVAPLTTAVGHPTNDTATWIWAKEMGLVNVTVAGNFSIEWAQQSTFATASAMRQGSRIIAERIA